MVGERWRRTAEGNRGKEALGLKLQHEPDVEFGERNRCYSEAGLGGILKVRTDVCEVNERHIGGRRKELVGILVLFSESREVVMEMGDGPSRGYGRRLGALAGSRVRVMVLGSIDRFNLICALLYDRGVGWSSQL